MARRVILFSRVQLVTLLGACLLLSGCFSTRVIVVPHGKPFLIGETVRDVKVLVKDSEGALVEGTADIPAGWICAPLKVNDGDTP